jgi:hypothetical protein
MAERYGYTYIGQVNFGFLNDHIQFLGNPRLRVLSIPRLAGQAQNTENKKSNLNYAFARSKCKFLSLSSMTHSNFR